MDPRGIPARIVRDARLEQLHEGWLTLRRKPFEAIRVRLHDPPNGVQQP